MKPWKRALGAIGLVLAVAFAVASCTPWNPLAGAGIGELKIFWLGYNRVYSANLDGSEVREIYLDSGMPSYRAIAVDPIERKLYWSDTMGNVVYRADLDGSGRETVASGVYAASLAVDPYDQKLYLADGATMIQRINLAGSGFETIYASGGTVSDLKLDLINGRIYWADGMAIKSSDLSNPLSPQTVVNSANTITAIALDATAGTLYYVDSAADSTIYKVGIPGGSPVGVWYLAGSAGGLDLDPHAGRLYWSRPSASTGIYIDSVRVDASGLTPIVSQPGSGDAQRLVLYLWP